MSDFDELFKGWVAGTLTAGEVDTFLSLLEKHNDLLPGRIDEMMLRPDIAGLGKTKQKNRLLSRLTEQIAIGKRPPRPLMLLPVVKWAAAAMLIVFAGSVYWYHQTGKKAPVMPPLGNLPLTPILRPGSNKATLLLSNGTTIFLDSSVNGKLAQQKGALIFNSDNGLISYKSTGQPTVMDHAAIYNTLSTPVGGQYKLRLSDGTLVWLNAESSITYPAAFNSKERDVTITGEAYFEIARNPARPFHVIANGMQVSVLGTHFNINAYEDEPSINTTLSEGRIKVSKSGTEQLMKPGQQLKLDKSGVFTMIANVDTNAAIAWKNGYFSFSHADLRTTMRQFARWYNVKVKYIGDIPDMNFTGDIPRSANAEEVLKILEESNTHFKVDGNTIIVSP